jgi:hypothetical protein
MNKYFCGDCKKALKPSTVRLDVYRCNCATWAHKKDEDLPTMTEIISFMTDRLKSQEARTSE